MKKVAVLLSAYNGEQYIKEQLDSILEQTYPDIEVYVRDDGSKDNTLEVLKLYEETGKIHLECGQNVGFVKSFEWLIANSGKADYYAFSDQDDVWFPDKVERAVKKMEKESSDIPILYFSNYDYYDGELNFIGHKDFVKPNISFINSLVDCVPLGFNTMFNYKAKEMVTNEMPEKSTGHDWWMYMVCAGLGKVIYDRHATVKYRRHENNVSDGGANFLKLQIWRFKRFFLNNYFAKIHEQIKDYKRIYYSRLSTQDKKYIDMFCMDGFHPLNQLKKTFYPKKLRQRAIDEFFIRIIFLIGRL